MISNSAIFHCAVFSRAVCNRQFLFVLCSIMRIQSNSIVTHPNEIHLTIPQLYKKLFLILLFHFLFSFSYYVPSFCPLLLYFFSRSFIILIIFFIRRVFSWYWFFFHLSSILLSFSISSSSQYHHILFIFILYSFFYTSPFYIHFIFILYFIQILFPLFFFCMCYFLFINLFIISSSMLNFSPYLAFFYISKIFLFCHFLFNSINNVSLLSSSISLISFVSIISISNLVFSNNIFIVYLVSFLSPFNSFTNIFLY